MEVCVCVVESVMYGEGVYHTDERPTVRLYSKFLSSVPVERLDIADPHHARQPTFRRVRTIIHHNDQENDTLRPLSPGLMCRLPGVVIMCRCCR